MENERKELEELREKYEAILAATQEDSFKVITAYVDEIRQNLNKHFTNGYHSANAERKATIDRQAIFVEKFTEILETGPQQTLDQVANENDRLDADEAEVAKPLQEVS